MDQSLSEAHQKIQSALDYLKRELSSIRAGRANPSLIEDIPVNVYGSRMKMQEVGTIGAPQTSLLTVQVWDISIINDVLKAIQEANLGLNPSAEGGVVRLPIPPLTAERREEFVKLSHQKMEEAKIEVRQIRQHTREGWESEMDAGKIGEDELKRREKLLQDLIDKTVDQIEAMGKQKEEELHQV